MGNSFFRKHPITLAIQAANLQSHYHGFICTLSNGALSCRAELKPLAASATYLIKIVYRMGKRPKVFVLQPEIIQEQNGKKVPHMYGKDEPCLHYLGEWKDDMLISMTIIPWASSWFLFYELWLCTGEWYGGGMHPETKRTKRGSK